MADYLSRTAPGDQLMPDIAKFSTPLLEVSPLNLISNDQVVDLQLLDIASKGSEEQGHILLGELVHEGYDDKDIHESHPS